MNVIENEIEAAIDKELQAATERFGLHHSNHEKMAVIVEEYEECAEAVEDMRQMMQMAWGRTRDNMEGYMMDDAYGRIYDAAVRTAIEAIQVAAMAKKEISEQDGRRPTATKHTAMSGSNGYIAYTCGVCGKHVGQDARYCGNCGAYFGE